MLGFVNKTGKGEKLMLGFANKIRKEEKLMLEKTEEKERKMQRQIKKTLCRYFTYGYQCPYKQECSFIHDQDIKIYVNWTQNIKLKQNSVEYKKEENKLLKTHKYSKQ